MLENEMFNKYLFNNEWRKTNRTERITKWLKRKDGLLIEKVRNNEQEWKITSRKKEKESKIKWKRRKVKEKKLKNCEKVNVWEIKSEK